MLPSEMPDMIDSIKGSATLQSKTVTPADSAQSVTADDGYDGLDTVTVNAIPDTYVLPTATKGATTWTPKTTAQTIAAGTYCAGKQTIAGDANLIAANILSGKTIFGVAGSASTSGAKFKTGSFTTSANTSSKTISHDLGATPNYVALFKTKTSGQAVLVSAYMSGSTISGLSTYPVNTSSNQLVVVSPTISVTNSGVTIKDMKSGQYTISIYGEYHYIIGVI